MGCEGGVWSFSSLAQISRDPRPKSAFQTALPGSATAGTSRLYQSYTWPLHVAEKAKYEGQRG